MHLWRINRYASDDLIQDAVTHVFVLVLWLGIGSERSQSQELHFKKLETCLYFARELVRRYGYPEPSDRATAYCLPKEVDPQKTKIY